MEIINLASCFNYNYDALAKRENVWTFSDARDFIVDEGVRGAIASFLLIALAWWFGAFPLLASFLGEPTALIVLSILGNGWMGYCLRKDYGCSWITTAVTLLLMNAVWFPFFYVFSFGMS